MRLRAIVFAIGGLGAAAAGAYGLGSLATEYFERTTQVQLAEALEAAGQDWARTEVDGLRIALRGEAPDETSRFRAREIVRRVAGRSIEDATTLRTANPLAPPPFALELLRNEDAVSLIGLVPEAGAREAIRAALAEDRLTEAATDMLETAARTAPQNWEPSLRLGLQALGALPQAKISVAPGAVAVRAVAVSDAEREALEHRLRAMAPPQVALSLEITAPRPVIAPFAVEFRVEEGTGRLLACAAETTEDAETILAAARETGLEGAADCSIGLGAPSPDWAEAVTHGLAALRALGDGGFALRDVDAVLSPPEDVAPERLAEVEADLEAALPPIIALAVLAPPTRGDTGPLQTVRAPRFEAVLEEDGAVRLTGTLGDATSRDAVTSYAAALFGHDRVTNATMIAPDLPEGWPGRVLAGVEALSTLAEGALEVTPEAVAVEGWGAAETAEAEVEALLAAKIAGGAVVDVRYDPQAVAAPEPAHTPPETCAAAVGAILAERTIGFAPGASAIEDESRAVITAIADVLRDCPGTRFEIAGHTDSQGAEESNLRLSQARASAVLAALEADLPLVALTARGYGEAEPVADNATEEGRAQNRRIAFTLLDPPAGISGRDAPPPGTPGAPPSRALDEAASETTVSPEPDGAGGDDGP